MESFVKVHETVPHLPVIVLATRTQEKLAASLMSLGAQDYLIIPELTGSMLAKAIYNASERQMIQEEHGRAGHLLELLMDNIPDSIYFKDLQSRFVVVNAAKAKRVRMSPEEMVGKTDFDFLPEEEARRAFEDDQFILKTGQALVNKIERLTGFSGDERWVSVTKIPWRDASGQVIGTMGVSRDITSWKRAEAELARDHELLQALVQSVPDSIYFKDSEHRFVLVNKAKADHWGVSPETMLGKTDFDFLPRVQAEAAFSDETVIMQTGTPIVDKVEKITGSDGSERWVSVTKLPRRDSSGMIIGTMGISRDITARVKERKETEKYKKVAIGQNLRMIELRDRVKELIEDEGKKT
jgi:PAS domain S-box-containing protein